MAPVLVIAYLATAMVATSPVAVTYQEWIRTYTARGGDAGFHEKDDWLGIAIPGGSRGGVSPGGLLRPKGVEEVRLSGAGVRNAHVVAVLRWPGVRRLYIQNCTGLDDTVFPLFGASASREIHIYDMPVTAAGVSGLSGSKTIQKINLVTTLNDKFADLKLTDMAQLESLMLLGFRITSVVLSEMPKLESIFDSSDLVPTRLRRVELSNLPLLPQVNFALAPVDKLVVDQCPALEEILVKKAKLSDDDIAALIRKNPKLKVVRR